MGDIEIIKSIARRMAVGIIDSEEFSVEVESVDVETPIHDFFYHGDDDCDYAQPGIYYRLHDNQCVNLGGIEDEYFSTLSEVIGRMGIYHEDYFYSDLSEQYENGNITVDSEDEPEHLWGVLCTKLLKSNIFYDLLDDSPCDEYISSYDVSYDELVTLKDFLYSKEPDLIGMTEF